jgi:hypothetical protein
LLAHVFTERDDYSVDFVDQAAMDFLLSQIHLLTRMLVLSFFNLFLLFDKSIEFAFGLQTMSIRVYAHLFSLLSPSLLNVEHGRCQVSHIHFQVLDA